LPRRVVQQEIARFIYPGEQPSRKGCLRLV
jgi:hypothetical protein